jgi:predicted nucleic acid-binding protein
MIHSVKFTCVLDTNVIHPIIIRDLLFWFAYFDLFTPKWSKHIFDEWKRLLQNKGETDVEIIKRIGKAQRAFPDALVDNYEPLIPGLTLPDENDCHVLAAAIKTNANVIVTNNLKDFPKEYLNSFGLTPKSADDFITDTIDLNPTKAVEAFKMMVLNKTKPDLNEFELLEQLRENGLVNSANYLHSQL